MTQTEHYGLSQWAAEDRILREDFNADNLALDGALHALSASLSGKAGRSELAEKITRSSNGLETGLSLILHDGDMDWSEWEYYAMLFHFPEVPGGGAPVQLRLFSMDRQKERIFQPLPVPGFLAVFLPWHDAGRDTAGFILADRLIPFNLGCPFSQFGGWNLTGDLEGKGNLVPFTSPNIAYFGAK